MDWDAPSIFTLHPVEEPFVVTNDEAYVQNHQVPQDPGTVFGNIDFGALFGLADAGLEGVRPWSPALFDGSSDTALTGSLLEGDTGAGFVPEGWSFDLG